MRNHDDSSVPARQRGRTEKRRASLRYSEFALANRGMLDRALEATQAMIPNARALASVPEMPSESTLSNWRTTEDSPLYKTGLAIVGGLAIGQPPESMYRAAIFVQDTIEIALATNRIPLSRAMLSAAAYDAEEDIAAFESLASGSREKKRAHIARLRVEMAAKRTLLTALLLDDEEAREEAAA